MGPRFPTTSYRGAASEVTEAFKEGLKLEMAEDIDMLLERLYLQNAEQKVTNVPLCH